MKVPFVDLKIQYDSIKSHIDKSIASVHDESRYIGGSKVESLERELEKYLQTKHCITTANGTDAIEIALMSLGVGIGDEVILPATSWISTASAVHTVGAKPVFVDITTDTYSIDPELIAPAVTERTRAIIPVHLYGQMANMNAISNIAKQYDLFVIEDAAQAIGASQDGMQIGAKSDLATLSFYPGKNLGAYGDGGAILTNETVLANSCKVIGSLGQKSHHDHVTLGRNSKLDAMQAAVLSVKLRALDKWNARRNAIAKIYNSLLADLPIQLPYIASDNVSNYHLYVIQVPNRNQVLLELKKAGITSQVHYPMALPDLQPFRNKEIKDYPNARSHAEKCLSLPMFPEMTKEQVAYVSQVLHQII